MSRYPLTMNKRSHGDLVAHTAAEERNYCEMGWLPARVSSHRTSCFQCGYEGPIFLICW
jgi:hypothetical protein